MEKGKEIVKQGTAEVGKKEKDRGCSAGQTIKITRKSPDYQKLIEKVAPLVKVVHAAAKLTKETTYIAQIPIEVRGGLEKGINSIMKSKESGKLRPIIVGPKDGKQRAILKQMDLIEKQGFTPESLDQLLSSTNYLIQQGQIDRIEKQLQSLQEGIRKLEMGQEAAREGHIQAGIEQIQRALKTSDPEERRRLFADGRNNIETGTGQIGILLEKKCRAFTPVSKDQFQRWLDGILSGGTFHESRIRDYNNLLELNNQYLNGRGILALSYACEGKEEQVGLVLQNTMDFLNRLETKAVLSVKNIPQLSKKHLFPEFWEGRINDRRKESRALIDGYDILEIEYDLRDLD